jgi:hypothetical protein
MSFIVWSIKPKLVAVGVAIGRGPVVVSGRAAGSEEGVIGFVIIGASGSPAGEGVDGRFVNELVPALSPDGAAGGLVASEGVTEVP